MERRVDRVRIQIRHTVREMPWAVSRDLVGRLMAARGADAERIAEQFRAVGVSHAVVIRRTDEPVLLAVLDQWLLQVDESEQAPQGVLELREALLY